MSFFISTICFVNTEKNRHCLLLNHIFEYNVNLKKSNYLCILETLTTFHPDKYYFLFRLSVLYIRFVIRIMINIQLSHSIRCII